MACDVRTKLGMQQWGIVRKAELQPWRLACAFCHETLEETGHTLAGSDTAQHTGLQAEDYVHVYVMYFGEQSQFDSSS